MDILKNISNKSLDHGLKFELAGKFDTEKELKSLLDDYDLDNDYSQELLDEGYVSVDGENIETIQIENDNELWIVYNDVTVLSDYIEGGLYQDKVLKDYLLVFPDGMHSYSNCYAIDLNTSTIGIIKFNSDNSLTYKKEYRLDYDDAELLHNIIEELDSKELGCKEKLVNR